MNVLMQLQIGLPLLPTLDGRLASINEDGKANVCICNEAEVRLFGAACKDFVLDSKACSVDTISR